MRTIWQSEGDGASVLRLNIVIASFIVSFFVVNHALAWIGATAIDANGGASIVALLGAAFTMYR